MHPGQDEDLYRDDLASKAIDDLASAAGKVDKQLLAGDAAPGSHWGGVARDAPGQSGIGR